MGIINWDVEIHSNNMIFSKTFGKRSRQYYVEDIRNVNSEFDPKHNNGSLEIHFNDGFKFKTKSNNFCFFELYELLESKSYIYNQIKQKDSFTIYPDSSLFDGIFLSSFPIILALVYFYNPIEDKSDFGAAIYLIIMSIISALIGIHIIFQYPWILKVSGESIIVIKYFGIIKKKYPITDILYCELPYIHKEKVSNYTFKNSITTIKIKFNDGFILSINENCTGHYYLWKLLERFVKKNQVMLRNKNRNEDENID